MPNCYNGKGAPPDCGHHSTQADAAKYVLGQQTASWGASSLYGDLEIGMTLPAQIAKRSDVYGHDRAFCERHANASHAASMQ